MSAGMPIGQVLLKIHGRCNLTCDYCYVYEHADQGWRRRPAAMSERVMQQVARRLGEHLAGSAATLEVVFHGGEPLLAGPDRLDAAAREIRRAVPVPVVFSVQTNGMLINSDFLDVFRAHGIRVGVSLDGGPEATDRHRRHADGRGSYQQAARGLELLRAEAGELFAGLLCTIDVDNDPIRTYEGLLHFAPPKLDLLLPHGTWDRPPPGRAAGATGTPYADWLIAVFDRWYNAPRPETSIRLFASICDLLLGGHSESEVVGLGLDRTVAVETDGSIGANDALKTTVDGGADTGLNVFDHGFADVFAHPAWSGPTGLAALAPACQTCPVVAVCGGGLPAHRFHPRNGLANPSVYCPDLFALIEHIRTRLEADLRTLRESTAARALRATA